MAAEGDQEELRIVMTHIDADAPDRQFVIGVFVEDDDSYAGAGQSPRDRLLKVPLLASLRRPYLSQDASVASARGRVMPWR